MNANPPVVCGAKAEWVIQALDLTTAVVGYSASDTPSARVIPGGSRPATITPTCSWLAGTGYSTGQILVSISSTQSASVTPGIYRIEAYVTLAADPSNKLLVYSGYVEFVGTAGSASAGITYGTFEDMKAYYPGIETFQADQDQTGFQYQREHAAKTLNSWIYNRYDPQPGFQKRRSSTYDGVYGFDKIDQVTIPLAKETVRTLLASSRLEIDRETVEMAARMAVASVLERNAAWISNTTSTIAKAEDNPYAKAAMDQLTLAKNVFTGWWARIDTVGSGTTTILIQRDCIYLSGYTT